MGSAMFGEIGRLGQKRYGGTFYEEFLTELRGRRGMAVYTEMADNDDLVGAVLFAIEMLIRQVDWTVEPAGDTDADRAAAEFVDGCREDMSDTWTDTVSEILSFLIYGWSAHELVYKRRMGRSRDPRLRSKYADGLIGWRKLPIRSQDSFYEWRYDGEDNLVGMVQFPPDDARLIEIPAEKLLLFRTKSRKGNPEGRSILRNAYQDWYFKRRIREIEGIGIERDLAGFPTLTAPPGMDVWDSQDPEMVRVRAAAEAMVKSIRRDAMEGAVLPADWKLELLSTGGRRQFDTNAIIERYDSRIAMTVLADFVLLGHQQVGSFALSSDKTQLFGVAIGAYLDIICQVFNNKAIPDLIDLNAGSFAGITDYPRLAHGDIETVDLGPLGEFLSKATASGLLVPDEGVEDYVRRQAGLPPRVEADMDGAQTSGRERTEPAAEDLEDEDQEAVAAAKRRLGRE